MMTSGQATAALALLHHLDGSAHLSVEQLHGICDRLAFAAAAVLGQKPDLDDDTLGRAFELLDGEGWTVGGEDWGDDDEPDARPVVDVPAAGSGS